MKSLFTQCHKNVLLFCIDSVMITLFTVCWANVYDAFLLPTHLQLSGTHIHRMLNLLKPGPNQQYVDLTVSFENEQEEDTPGPPIRYYF